MRKFSLLLLMALSIAACSKKESNLVVNGNIKGLKKGTVYLQKIVDTTMQNIDSVEINGDPNFVLEANIESPQVMYLYLEKVDNSDFNDRLEFFADKGKVNISTKLEKFESEAQVKAGKNQEKLEEYRKMMSRFNDDNLDLIKADFEAKKEKDMEKLEEINQKYDRLLKRKYLYTVNFAINNKDLEIAPYLVLSEVYDANIKYLDTVYNSLTKHVKKSIYGKELKRYLGERHKQEDKNSDQKADDKTKKK